MVFQHNSCCLHNYTSTKISALSQYGHTIFHKYIWRLWPHRNTNHSSLQPSQLSPFSFWHFWQTTIPIKSATLALKTFPPSLEMLPTFVGLLIKYQYFENYDRRHKMLTKKESFLSVSFVIYVSWDFCEWYTSSHMFDYFNVHSLTSTYLVVTTDNNIINCSIFTSTLPNLFFFCSLLVFCSADIGTEWNERVINILWSQGTWRRVPFAMFLLVVVSSMLLPLSSLSSSLPLVSTMATAKKIWSDVTDSVASLDHAEFCYIFHDG